MAEKTIKLNGDEIISVDEVHAPIQDAEFHYLGISKPFEKKLKEYVNLDKAEFLKILDSLPEEHKKPEADFLDLKLEELLNIPVDIPHQELIKVVKSDKEGSVDSLQRTVDLNATLNADDFLFLSQMKTMIFTIPVLTFTPPTVSSILPPPPVNSTHGLPTTPNITVNSAFTGGLNTEVLLETQTTVSFGGSVITQGAGGGSIFNAYFKPPVLAGSFENRNISGEVILTTPQGNTFTFYTLNVNGHHVGDFVYTLNDAILTPPQPFTIINGHKTHSDFFQYSLTDSFNDTNVGTIEIQIIDDVPVATNQNAPSALSEANILNIGSNEPVIVSTLSGSLIVPSIQATPPGPGDLSNNRFGANGGYVSNVTVAGGTTVLNGANYTVTDSLGNTLVVNKFTGNYVYTLNAPFHNTNNQPFHENFTYQFTDNEGQTASAVLTVTINDDAPHAANLTNSISEANIKTIGSNGSNIFDTVTGLLVPASPTISTSRYGADGPASSGGVTNATLASVSGTSGVTGNTTFSTITNTQITNSNGAFTNANLGDASVVVTDSLNNTLVIDSVTGRYVYTLNTAFTDSNNQPAIITFTYQLTDSDGSTNSANLAITVADDQPIATAKSNTANETLLFVNGTNTASGNFITDNNGSGVSLLGADGGTVSKVNGTAAVSGIITASTTYGSITVYATAQSGHQKGDYIYSLDSTKTGPVNDALGQVVDTISYQLTDGDNSTSSSDLSITITLNQPPTANNDTGTTDQGTILSVSSGSGVLVNDTVSTGDTKVVSAVNGQTNKVGTSLTLSSGALLTLNSDGSYTYNPNGNFLGGGSDSFTYTLTEAEGLTSNATVNITITAPQAVNDSGSVNIDGILAVNVGSGLLSNDVKSPVDNTLTVAKVNGSSSNVGVQIALTSGALLTVHSNGSYSYNPNLQFECGGSDSFTYQAADGHNGLSNVATVSITITGDGAPVAVNDTASTHAGTPIVMNAVSGLLSNDTPNDADSSIAVTAVNGVSGNVGTQISLASGALLTVNSDGSYTYNDNGEFASTGTDNFTYTAGTACGTSDASVTITINVPPIILDLDGDGIELISVENSTVSWVFPCGNEHITGWVAPDDGILVFDFDHDGKITQLEEFSFAAYHPDAKTDLDGLRLVFDTNHDGIFDANDTYFSQFAVWQDLNSNGITDEGELQTLIQRGITSINLNANPQNQLIDGNIIFGLTTYQTTDGEFHIAADVGFKVGEILSLKDVLIEKSEIDCSSLPENSQVSLLSNPIQPIIEQVSLPASDLNIHLNLPTVVTEM